MYFVVDAFIVVYVCRSL